MDFIDESVVFKPWPGEHAKYIEGIQGKRLLVLGESHYHNCDNDPPCRDAVSDADRTDRHSKLTFEVVSWWKDKPHRSPLSHYLPKLIGLEKLDFWTRVVFYNYLQDFVGLRPRVKQSEGPWSEALNSRPFQAVIDHFEPDRILVLGKKLWSNLPSHAPPLAAQPQIETKLTVANNIGGYNSVDEHCYWYVARSGKRALAMPIMHPSAPGFKLDDWRQPVEDWLSFPS